MSSTPHDGLFKAVFSHPEHARGALRAVVPAAMAEALDWSTLALQPGSFVDPLLIERHTDLLFTTAWRGGAEALVYLLFEHQSTPRSLKPLDVGSRLLFWRALRFLLSIKLIPKKRITAEIELIDKRNVQTYVDRAVVRPPRSLAVPNPLPCSNR